MHVPWTSKCRLWCLYVRYQLVSSSFVFPFQIIRTWWLHDTRVPVVSGPPRYPGFTITLRRTTFARTSLDGWSARQTDLYLTTHNTHNRHVCHRRNSNPHSQQASDRRPTPYTAWTLESAQRLLWSSVKWYSKTRSGKSNYRGADKSLARPGRKHATATEDFDVHISYL